MKDRTFFIIVALEIVVTAGVVGGLILGAAVFIGLPTSPTQALNLAAPTNTLPPTSAIAALPPGWAATPFSTQVELPATQPPLAPTNTLLPASPSPSATLPTVDTMTPTVEAPTDEPTASLIALPASTESSALPTETPSGTPEPAPTSLPIIEVSVPTQRVEAGGMALTLLSASKQGDSEAAYLVVNVVLENVSGEQTAYELACFNLVDSEGLLYDASDDAPEPSLLGGDLAGGSQVRGNVAFYIGPETQGLTFIFSPLLLSDDSELIRVSLGQ